VQSITGAATGVVTALHDRMPMIVPVDSYERWLAPDARGAELEALMKADASAPGTYPVSLLVNSPANDDPACIERAEPASVTLPLFAS
jgi:putative SOS response-associated peptidase YedK